MLQDRQIAVGLYGKTQGVGNISEPGVQFAIGVVNRGPAVDIGWRANFSRDVLQRYAVADHHFGAILFLFLPGKMRGEVRWVHERSHFTEARSLAHRTL